jgi:hypothetical protein
MIVAQQKYRKKIESIRFLRGRNGLRKKARAEGRSALSKQQSK